jgi:hypothetical protein
MPSSFTLKTIAVFLAPCLSLSLSGCGVEPKLDDASYTEFKVTTDIPFRIQVTATYATQNRDCYIIPKALGLFPQTDDPVPQSVTIVVTPSKTKGGGTSVYRIQGPVKEGCEWKHVNGHVKAELDETLVLFNPMLGTGKAGDSPRNPPVDVSYLCYRGTLRHEPTVPAIRCETSAREQSSSPPIGTFSVEYR